MIDKARQIPTAFTNLQYIGLLSLHRVAISSTRSTQIDRRHDGVELQIPIITWKELEIL